MLSCVFVVAGCQQSPHASHPGGAPSDADGSKKASASTDGAKTPSDGDGNGAAASGGGVSQFERNRQLFIDYALLAASECDVLADANTTPAEIAKTRWRIEQLRVAINRQPDDVRAAIKVPDGDKQPKLVHFSVVADNRRIKVRMRNVLMEAHHRTGVLENALNKKGILRDARFRAADSALTLRKFARWMKASSSSGWRFQPRDEG